MHFVRKGDRVYYVCGVCKREYKIDRRDIYHDELWILFHNPSKYMLEGEMLVCSKRCLLSLLQPLRWLCGFSSEVTCYKTYGYRDIEEGYPILYNISRGYYMLVTNYHNDTSDIQVRASDFERWCPKLSIDKTLFDILKKLYI